MMIPSFTRFRCGPLPIGILLLAALLPGREVTAGQLAEAGFHQDPVFNTFSIAAVDPTTGESGVAVTTRNACVGNAVPWVRAGVGAVATQARTRMEYGPDLLNLLEEGVPPQEALARLTGADAERDRRQVGVVALDGGSAQHTGVETSAWAGHRAGPNYVAQGNLLEGPEVVEAVSESFEESEGSGRHLADRLVAALEAGQAAGGDARKGRIQSAAVLVADPREGVAMRSDGVAVDINVCEHPEAVGEVRRQYDVISGVLGHRTLQHFAGDDVAQLKILLHTLGHFRPEVDELSPEPDWTRYTEETAEAVDAFRAEVGLSTPEVGTPQGFVDKALVDALWSVIRLEGLEPELRARIRELTTIRR